MDVSLQGLKIQGFIEESGRIRLSFGGWRNVIL
jgi:hypothetical protein